MAGIGLEQITPIRPEIATSQIQPLQLGVQQNAVAALSDAFRQGVITSDDIISRYGDLAKTEQKAKIQGLDELISPEAIAQRKQHAELLSDKDKAEIANLPAAQAAELAKLQQIKLQADQGDRAAMREYAIKNGFAASLSQMAPGETYTKEHADKDAQVYQDAVRYAQAVKAAQDTLKDINPVPNKKEFSDDTGTSSETDYENPILTSGTGKHTYTQDQSVKASSLANMTPQEWLAAGKPTSGEYIFGAKPVEKPAAAVENPVQPVNELVTPRKTTEVEERKANGDVKITRTVVEPTENPNIPKSIKDLKPGQSFKAAPVKEKTPQEAQGRALNALARFASSNDMQKALTEAGFDPTSVGTWMKNLLPEMLKSGDVKAYNAAKDLWLQGLLRLESGAAISASEKQWYENSFFPRVNDTPSIVESKRSAREGIERMVSEYAQAGGVVSPEAIAAQWKLKNQGSNVPGASPEIKPTTLSTGNKIYKDPATGQWLKAK